MDEHAAAMMGDWVPPSPSPKAFFSSLLGGDEQISTGPMPQIPDEARNGGCSSFGSYQGGMGFEDDNAKQRGISFENDLIFSPLPDHNKPTSRGGLVDRIAARAGFNAPRLNTESIILTDRSSTGEVKSPYFTIPTGISPTALLESPVFLSNPLTQASPTTGKFPLFAFENNISSMVAENAQSKEDFFDDVDGSSFAFKPPAESGLSFSLGSTDKMNQLMNPQALPKIEVSVRSENFFRNSEPSLIHSHEGGFSRSLTEKDLGEITAGSDIKGLDTISGTAEHSPPQGDQHDDEGDQRISSDSYAGGSAGSLAEDGYNWRKYGQKQVKGSEYPRSYFRCTHMNCPVKKKVERSHEGIVTEIIYKGAHNHPKPAPNHRSSIGSNQLDDTRDQVGLENGGDRDSVWGTAQNGLLPVTHEWRNDSFEHKSLSSMNSELRNPSSSLQMQNGAVVESGDVVDPSSTCSNDEEEDDRVTHGSVSIANDGEGDESESKRRKIETYAAEIGGGATRAIREPRVVVQTTSDVDILDDGYRWRKYGQKVVKGNPNPRSYYKCTSAGCSVRKHVERASHDLKSVITTYEGKHNHDVPAARNSSHVSSAASANGGMGSQSQSLIPRHEPSQVTSMARYERQPHLSSFNLPMMQSLGAPPHGFPTGVIQSSLANMSMAGLGPGQNKFPGIPAYPYLMQQQQLQQRHVNDLSFMMPKGEAKVEPNSDPNVYHPNGSSVYNRIVNRLPLGP
uniref:WRKY domain-containing protein n=1 Tax=Kalanchoe fedtschenkoi TaxID=63787 RepID=A0A7N0ZU12_KALFE